MFPCPFLAGGMITEANFFVGRDKEIGSMIRCMTGDQPRSVNVVGDRKIGKSSLLWHFCTTYEARVSASGRQPQNFVVVYLSLKKISAWSPECFYQEMAQCLRQRVQGRPELSDPMRPENMNYQEFRSAVEQWKKQSILPVLCLDDFDTLLKHRDNFNNNFYDNLRSILDSGLLMLVVASKKPLREEKRRYRYTSSFFNLFQLDRLGELSTTEANRILNFPIGQASKLSDPPAPKSLRQRIANGLKRKKQPEPLASLSLVAVLSDEEQKLAGLWAGNQPYLLQLAGQCLWEAQQNRETNAWARKKFDDNAKEVPTQKRWGRMTVNGLNWVGGCAQYIGGLSGNWGKTIAGAVVLAVIVGVLMGQNPNKLIDWGKKMLTDALDKGKVPELPKTEDRQGGQGK